MKLNKYFWIFLFASIFLIISGIINYNSLFGQWGTALLWGTHGWSWDPGASYLAAGITFFSEEYVFWVGHPGHTLMFLIQIVSWILYLVTAGSHHFSVSFETFAAKNIALLIIVTKTFMSVIYLLSGYVMYVFALKITEKKEVALLSAIACLTTFPVLFYFNVISADILMLMFALLAFLCIWKSYDEAGRGGLKFYAWLVLSALTTALALCTKLMIAAPLIIFIPAYLFLYSDENVRLSINKRLKYFLYFLLFLIFFTIIIGWKVNWIKFFRYWSNHTPNDREYLLSASVSLSAKMIHTSINLIKAIASGIILFFTPKRNPYWLFVIAEFLFFMLSVLGFYKFWKTETGKKKRLIWLLIFVFMFTPVFLYTHFWHYVFVHMAIFSIFFSYFVWTAVDGKFASFSNSRKIVICVAVILLVHSFSIYLVADSKLNSIRKYKNWKPYYDALSKINYNEKIGLVNPPDFLNIFGYIFTFTSKSSNFNNELKHFFVSLDGLDEKTLKKKMAEENIRIVLYGNGNNDAEK